MRRTGTGRTTVAGLPALVLALALAWPAGAAAGGVATVPAGTSRADATRQARAAYDVEARILGGPHAREHLGARLAAARRTGRPAARRPQTGVTTAARRRPRALTTLPAGEAGRWQAPEPLRAPAIHAVLLPTGKILYFSYPFGVDGDAVPPQAGDAWLLDPETGQSTHVPPPPDGTGNASRPALIFCAGQSLMADGRVLVTGGTLEWEAPPVGYKGHPMALVFDPWREQWVVQWGMQHGRWYPAQRLLDDNRTLVMGGTDETGLAENADVDLFTPASGGWWQPGRFATASRWSVSQYAHLFQLPDRRVVVAGPGAGDDGAFFRDSAIAGPDLRFDFLPAPSRTRAGSTALQRFGVDGAGGFRVTQIGGTTTAGDAAITSESIDYAAAQPSWTTDPQPLNVRRSYANTVELPGGSAVTIGGGAGKLGGSLYNVDAGAPQRAVELLDPASGTWRLGAAQRENRAYHSVALLLPDGRVWSAGDDDWAAGRGQDTAEIYEPPYLHRGPRPAITWAPRRAGWGQSFALHTSGPAVARATLIAPGAVTHASDMSARAVPLSVTADPSAPGRSTLRIPEARTVVPEGFYMLFAVTADGVPSIARWVHVTGVGAPEPGEPRVTEGGTGAAGATPPAAPAGATRRVATVTRPTGTRRRHVPSRAALRAAARRRALVVGRRPWPRAEIRVTIAGRLAGRRFVRDRGAVAIPLAGWAVRALRTGRARGVLVTATRR